MPCVFYFFQDNFEGVLDCSGAAAAWQGSREADVGSRAVLPDGDPALALGLVALNLLQDRVETIRAQFAQERPVGQESDLREVGHGLLCVKGLNVCPLTEVQRVFAGHFVARADRIGRDGGANPKSAVGRV